jgi:hypothetical protein
MAREFESVEYRFNDEELLALGKELARTNQQIYDFRAEKKAVTASLTGSIETAETRAAELTGMIERRMEMRDVEVVAVMDRPRVGLKTIVRADNGVDVRVAVMTLEEQQATLDFGPGDQSGGAGV